MYAGYKQHLLETKAWADGGNVQINVRGIERGRRVKGILLRADLAVKQSGAAALVTGDQLQRLIKNVRLGDRVLGSGMSLRTLAWHMRGLNFASDTADVPATNSATFQRIVSAFIPFEDASAFAPDDACPAPEFYDSTPLIVEFERSLTLFSALDAATPVVGTVRAYVVHEPLDYGIVPAIAEIGYLDPNAQHFEIPGERVFTHLHLFKESGAKVDSTEITGFTLTADGVVLSNLPTRPQDAVQFYDWARASGGALNATSATAPVLGEQLGDLPSVSAAAAATVSMEWVPLYTPPNRYKLSKALHVEQSLVVDLQGSMSSGFRVGYRAILPRTQAQQERAKQVLGIVAKEGFTKTASKTGNPSPRLARILPTRYNVG